MTTARIVGTSVPRMEGRDKVAGLARYVDDMVLPGMLYVAAFPGARSRNLPLAQESIGKNS